MAIRSDLVVGADGIGSSVARLAGAETVQEVTKRDCGHVRVLSRASSWPVTTGGIGRVSGPAPFRPIAGGIASSLRFSPERLRNGSWRADRSAAFREILREADPALAALVAGSEPDEPLRVFAGRKGFLRQAYGPGWALVGDAGYFKDPLTAHGITDALRDAELLANAAAAGTEADFADYAATRDDLSMPLFEVSDAIAALDWDLDQIRALHQTLNHAMKREVEHLMALGDAVRPLHPANQVMIEEEVL